MLPAAEPETCPVRAAPCYSAEVRRLRLEVTTLQAENLRLRTLYDQLVIEGAREIMRIGNAFRKW